MVAVGGRPLHRAGSNRAWIWILLRGSAELKPSAAVELTPLLKERPTAAEAKAWCEDNLPRLPADQRALILGLTPRGALQYEPDPIPAALVVDSSTGVTAVMGAQRDALRFTRRRLHGAHVVPWAHSPIWSRQDPIFISFIQIVSYNR